MLITDYDIRGIFPKELSYEIIRECIDKFLKYINKRNFILAIDSNEKSLLVRDFILDNYPQTIYLGKLPTPIFYFQVIKKKHPGIIITASHLSSKYVGMKFLLEDGTSWKPKINKQKNKKKKYSNFKTKEKITNFSKKIEKEIFADYFNFLSKSVRFYKKVFVNFDLSNFFLKTSLPYFKKLNIHHSKTSPWKITSDQDNDRLSIFYQGKEVPLDFIFYLIALEKKYQRLGVPIFFSKKLERLLKLRKKTFFYITTGHNNFKLAYKKYNLDLAFEPSGHFYLFKDIKTESPYLALLKFLKLIQKEKALQKFLNLTKEIKIERFNLPLKNKKISINFQKIPFFNRLSYSKNFSSLENLVSFLLEKFDLRMKQFDGFLLYNQDISLHIRKSKTENILRISFEY